MSFSAFSTDSCYNKLSFNDVLLCIFTRRPATLYKKSGGTFMKITQLEYFCATCRHHSITQAARELYVTQPAISSAIRELEKEFSINLFIRSKNHVTLTKEGELFLSKSSGYCYVILKKVLQNFTILVGRLLRSVLEFHHY